MSGRRVAGGVVATVIAMAAGPTMVQAGLVMAPAPAFEIGTAAVDPGPAIPAESADSAEPRRGR